MKEKKLNQEIEVAKRKAEANVREKARKEGRNVTKEEIRAAVLRAEADVITEALKKKVSGNSTEEPKKSSEKKETAKNFSKNVDDSKNEDWVQDFVKNIPDKSSEEEDLLKELIPEKTQQANSKKKNCKKESDSFGKFAEEEVVSKDRRPFWLKVFAITIILLTIAILVVVFIPNKESNDDFYTDFDASDFDSTGTVSNKKNFDISKFNALCVNLGEYQTDEEDIAGNVYKTTENIGTKKLAELTKKYGETNVANTIVNIIVGGSEAAQSEKVAKEGWQYNPNATDDYYNTYMDICKTYETKTGKKATVVMDSIEAYKANPGNRSAIEKEIRSTGDLDLLEWYQAHATASDVLTKQSRDTQLAYQYKENIEDKLVESESFINILEKVLQKQKTGDFAVIENNEYSKEFKDYIAMEIATVVGAAK